MWHEAFYMVEDGARCAPSLPRVMRCVFLHPPPCKTLHVTTSSLRCLKGLSQKKRRNYPTARCPTPKSNAYISWASSGSPGPLGQYFIAFDTSCADRPLSPTFFPFPKKSVRKIRWWIMQVWTTTYGRKIESYSNYQMSAMNGSCCSTLYLFVHIKLSGV